MRTTLSIIVPVYNSKQYLERCIKSILNSRFVDFELLLIDDGSTDGSSEICDTYASSDERVFVTHTVNSGVSYARNIGLQKAKGKWITFIDSDDYIDDKYLETLLIDGEEDFVWTGYKNVFQGGIISIIQREDRLMTIEDFKKEVTHKSVWGFPMTVWGGCYKKELIDKEKLLFDIKRRRGEDTIFNLGYLSNAKKIRVSSSIGYNYEQVHTSLRHSFTENWAEQFEAEGRQLDAFCGAWYYQARDRRWHNIIAFYEEWEKKQPELKKICTQKIKECYKNPYYREVIPLLRKDGSTDQKIESYFMGYYRHKIYTVFILPILKGLSRKASNNV